MSFTRWIHSHHRSILFLVAALAVGGLISSFSLPVSLFPAVHFPRAVVELEAGDRPAERMAIEVTWPVEEAVRSVEGVRNIRSKTSRGSAEISVNFDWNADMAAAALQIESAVNQVMPSLPQGTSFSVRRMDPTVFPVLCYSITSEKRTPVELRDIAQYQLRPTLATVDGVAKTDVAGGAVEEYRVEADPARLRSYGLTLEDLGKALSASNVLTAVGRLEDHDKLYLIISDTGFPDVDTISGTIIKSDENGVVRLANVATVRPANAPDWTRATADGRPAVIVQVYQQPGGNTVAISREIKSRLAELQTRLPGDVKIANWYDQGELIVSSAKSVRDAVIVGIFMAILILLVFLRSVRTVLIAAVVVPAVLAVTVLMLYVLHMSFNIMTLGGMAAAVGLIIDDAIVMIEHVVRRMRGGQDHHRNLILRAVDEFTGPLAGSSASTIVIFTPLAFLTGVTGAFFKALSLTMAASLVISFFVAWVAVPLLAARLLDEKETRRRQEGFILRPIKAAYAAVMRPMLGHPWLILIVIGPLVATGWFAYQRVGSGFMPQMDEGGFVLDYVAPPGTSLAETDRLLVRVESIIRSMPEVDTYSRRTGLQLGGGITEANEGDFFVRLKPMPRRPIENVMSDVRGKVEQTVPGLDIEMFQLMEDVIGDLIATPQPIEVELYSDDGKILSDLAPRIEETLKKIPGVVDVTNGLVIAGDALEVTVDRQKAALEGVDPETVTGVVEDNMNGRVSTQVQRTPKMVDVRVWTSEKDRATEQSILDLTMKAPDGHEFPLRRVVTTTRVIGQPQITRDDLKRMVAVTGRISGRDMGSTIRDVKAALNKEGVLPAGVYYKLGGLYAQQQMAFKGLVAVIAAAVLLVFLLLLFLYERFRVAVAMLATTLLALATVFIGLWLTDTELNISSMMGMTMVVGIVTEVSIFYFSEYRELPRGEDTRDALIDGGRNRMRPIAMTTFAAIFALAPLALGIGQGSAMQQPLAIAIISGLVVQLPLALVVLPALLAILRVPHGEGKRRD